MNVIKDSRQLLQEYASNGCESAFQQIVERYINFVFSTALRLTKGESQLAEDITQTVFISLAQKARTLSRDVMLGGWLHQRTFHVATRAVRGEMRRRARESEAIEMNAPEPQAEQVLPLLDEAITQLGEAERAAILLRFFEQRDFRAVGTALGVNEDAARMRVNRAVDKLHMLLKKRGVAFPACALSVVLATKTLSAAPAGLALSVCSASIAAASASTGLSLTISSVMTATKFKVGVAALLFIGVTAVLIVEQRSRDSIRRENDGLRAQLSQLTLANEALAARVAEDQSARAQRLSRASGAGMASTQPSQNAAAPKNLYASITNATKLTAQQVVAFLAANRRNAASLLAAFRTTGDAALLEEAMQRFPNDPQVSFEAALRKEVSAEHRRKWLDAFKQSAPDNALADYLSAGDHFKSGRKEEAINELMAATAKKQFDDYSIDRVQDDEEAYRSAGISVAEAKVISSSQLLLPQLLQLKQLSQAMVDLAKSYRQTGDDATGQAMLQMTLNLGQRYVGGTPGEPLISQLVGIAIERNALNVMDPTAPYGSSGQTAGERLSELTQQRAAIQDLNNRAEPLLEDLPEQDWITYKNRSMAFGEQNALKWLVGKYGRE